MPFTPLKPCRWRGCPALVRTPFCPAHAKAYDAQRPTAPQRGYGAEHRIWRAAVLARDPYCVDPDGRHPGQRRLSLLADHIVPLRAGGTWELANGQGLCLSCGNAKTARHDGGFGNRVAPQGPE